MLGSGVEGRPLIPLIPVIPTDPSSETPESLLATIQALWRSAHVPRVRQGRGYRHLTEAEWDPIATEIRAHADRFRALGDDSVRLDYAAGPVPRDR